MDTFELLLNNSIIYCGSWMSYIWILKLPQNAEAVVLYSAVKQWGVCSHGSEQCIFLPDSKNLTDKQLCFSGQQ